jgi:dethiobiotin synthetase|tara:strand:- start:1153 stop:1758 length:606 start_codon:yes stop_codon:yes gene_type:complete
MRLFVTGIGTEVGKTIASSILVENLKADYWKPIQAGELENSDSIKVKNLISNTKSVFHSESYKLKEPMSPHAAAERDNITIELLKIIPPKTDNHLVIEGAGGVFVPLNKEDCILDIIPKTNAEVVIVSRHYLGSINHTLLTIKALQDRNISIKGIIFSGDENKDTENIIIKMTGIKFLFRINEEIEFNKEIIKKYAQQITL